MQENPNPPAIAESAMPQALVKRFQDRIQTAHALVALALLGATSLPEAVQAQTTLPEINVVGTPSPWGGGWGGGGYGGGDVTGCGYECDGSANGPIGGGTVITTHHPGGDDALCTGDQLSRHLSAIDDFKWWRATHLFGAGTGDIVVVTYSDGGSEEWIVSNPLGSEPLFPLPVPNTRNCD